MCVCVSFAASVLPLISSNLADQFKCVVGVWSFAIRSLGSVMARYSHLFCGISHRVDWILAAVGGSSTSLALFSMNSGL